jgi:hypothetical protein
MATATEQAAPPDEREVLRKNMACSMNPVYFIDTRCRILSGDDWVTWGCTSAAKTAR